MKTERPIKYFMGEVFVTALHNVYIDWAKIDDFPGRYIGLKTKAFVSSIIVLI